MRRNVLSFLDDYARRGEATAFAGRRGLRVVRWSYARVLEAARRLAREMEERGIGKGDRVMLRAENSPEWVAAFFGCALRGAVVVPLDVESEETFVERVAEQTRPVLVIDGAGERRAPPGLPRFNLTGLEERISRHPASAYRGEELGRDDLLEIIYTSGTTTEPKGVVLTHGNLLANLLPLESEIQKYLRWERAVHPIRFLSSLPLSHVFGQLMTIFVPQLLGGELFFQNSLNPSEMIETARRERISVLVTVPRVLDLLRERVARDWEGDGGRRSLNQAVESANRWSVLRRLWTFRSIHRRFGWKFWAFISGGATLPAETENFWQRLGFAVIQGYGMTETASLISVNHPFKKSQGSIGRTLQGQTVRLDETGEILVRGANVSPGYWTGDKDGFSGTHDGWLRTGDVGEMDAEGNLYFRGRKKDVIVTAAGLNIYPEDLEAALHSQPEVLESVVIPFETARGTEPLAVIIMRERGTEAEEVIRRANILLAKHQQIRHHFVWPEQDFPRTATQKIIRREVARRVKSLAAHSSEPEQTSTALAEIIKRIGGSKCTEIVSSSNLASDLNLDSLGRVELLSALEERYQIEMDEAAFTSAVTLADVERMVKEGAHDESTAQYPYPEWARRPPVTWVRSLALYLFVLPLTSIMCWVRVRGRENLKDLRAPVLFVSNHISMVDHALVLSALPGRFRRRLAIAMEGEILRDWIHPVVRASRFTRLRWLVEYVLVVMLFNVFPLPKKSGFRRSFNYAGEMMDRGFSVLVFPEGTRSEDGLMNPFMAGSGLLAKSLCAAVVPVKIEGLFKLKKQGRHFALPGEVSIIFGEPLRFSSDDDPAHAAALMERRVREL